MSDSKIKAIVVGASGGIGERVCERLAEQGGEAFLIGRTADKLRSIADRYGWGFAVADAADWPTLDAVVSSGEGLMGGINAAINLAGSILLKPLHLTNAAEWDATVRANLTTSMGLVRACVPRMFSTGGSVVLMSSAAASIGMANHEAIAACKAGIEGLVRSAAASYASKKIRVNAVAPGLVETGLSERIWSSPKASEVSLAMHPMGRFGQPDEIASAVVWLASPTQSWVTGHVLNVDGGLSSIKSTPTIAR